jgi:hypothetical protein
MRKLACLVVVGALHMSSSARASEDTGANQRRVLELALLRAGPPFAHLPIVLTTILPWTASPGAEAWTVFFEDGRGDRIFVYTGSEVFQCASTSRRDMWQCGLRLASIIVHEAWHLRHGKDEAGAYEAQLTFMILNDGSGEQIAPIRLARNRVVAARRRAAEAEKTPTEPPQSIVRTNRKERE